MKALVKFVLKCTTAGNASTVLTAVNSRLSSLTGVTVRAPLRIVVHPSQGRLVTATLLIDTEADASQLVSDLQTLWAGTQASRILAGSEARLTRNRDDEGNNVPDEPVTRLVK